MTFNSKTMKFVFRTDASLEIGTGHVMRCLTLANKLKDKGAQIQFLCRLHCGNLIELIQKSGFEVLVLYSKSKIEQKSGFAVSQDISNYAHWLRCDWQTDARQSLALIKEYVDWIIVDHYSLDHRWETALRKKCHKIMCIDDLANRIHDCDLLLDQNLGRTTNDYKSLVPINTIQILGPNYALLRPEFSKWRNTSLDRRQDPKLCHLLISMGGVDKENITSSILLSLKHFDNLQFKKITVVLGPNTPWIKQVKSIAAEMPIKTEVLTGVENMAELMTYSDFAIGGAGSTTWERCALGLPTIQIELAENQNFINKAVSSAGAAVICDKSDLKKGLVTKLKKLNIEISVKNLILRASKITCGLGADYIQELLLGELSENLDTM